MAGQVPMNAYIDTQIKTASREQLLIMLFDGAVRFAHQAKSAIEVRNIEQVSVNCLKVQNIMTELMSSLDKDLISDELYRNLMSLYAFVHKRMVSANLDRNPAHIDEAVTILHQLRGVWQEAIARALEEHGGKLPPPQTKVVTRNTVRMENGLGAPDTGSAGSVALSGNQPATAPKPAPVAAPVAARPAAPAPSVARPAAPAPQAKPAAPFPAPTKPSAPMPVAAKAATPAAAPAKPEDAGKPGFKKPKINLSR